MSTTKNYIEYLHSLGPKDVMSMKLSMQFGEENKYVTVDFNPKKFSQIELLHITDVQFGHKMCNVEKFKEYCQWVLKKPNRFVFFGGDMIDAATAISIASPYDNTEEPQGQVYRFCEIANTIRHRIMGYVGGNHERRGQKTFGDLGKLIAMLLRIPYSSGKQFIDINFGKHQPFKVTLHHGTTHSKTKGARLNMIKTLMDQGDSHLYLVGHLHDFMMTSSVRQKQINGEIILEEYAGAMSSSFLEHFGTYAEAAMLAPGTIKMWRAVLEADGRWDMTARFNIQ
jgi:predicted MPP superfamily phosphohydrolase